MAIERLNRASRVQVTLSVLFTQVVAARSGINLTDLQCLNLLTMQGPMTPSALAEALTITKGGAVTAMLDRLESARLIRRSRGNDDRRRVYVEPVPGKALNAVIEHYRPMGETTDALLDSYSTEQLAFLADHIERTNAAISAPDGPLLARHR